jgi:hypothetical protein
MRSAPAPLPAGFHALRGPRPIGGVRAPVTARGRIVLEQSRMRLRAVRPGVAQAQ